MSLYTPVFYTESVSAPDLSPANLKRLARLSKRHIALAQRTPAADAPASRSPSPCSVAQDLDDHPTLQHDFANGLDPSIARHPHIRHLRVQISEALASAEHNPSHGKWALVSRLLRLGVTSGRKRWVGTRADGEPVDLGAGWCNASTEEEWAEWEKKYVKEQDLKKRVEEWTRTVVQQEEEESLAASTPRVTTDENSKGSASVRARDAAEIPASTADENDKSESFETAAKQTTVVGLALGKMSRQNMSFPAPSLPASQLVAPTPKAANTRSGLRPLSASSKPLLRPTPQRAETERDERLDKSKAGKNVPLATTSALRFAAAKHTNTAASLRAGEKSAVNSRKNIADISDMSYPAPSLPASQLVTSTPQSANLNSTPGRKPRSVVGDPPLPPTSIFPVANNEGMPSTPPLKRVYGEGPQSPSVIPGFGNATSLLTEDSELDLEPNGKGKGKQNQATPLSLLPSPFSTRRLKRGCTTSMQSPSSFSTSLYDVPASSSRARTVVPAFAVRDVVSQAGAGLKRKFSFGEQKEEKQWDMRGRGEILQTNKRSRLSQGDEVVEGDGVETPTKRDIVALPTLSELLASAKKISGGRRLRKSSKNSRSVNRLHVSPMKTPPRPTTATVDTTPGVGSSFGNIPGLPTIALAEPLHSPVGPNSVASIPVPIADPIPVPVPATAEPREDTIPSDPSVFLPSSKVALTPPSYPLQVYDKDEDPGFKHRDDDDDEPLGVEYDIDDIYVHGLDDDGSAGGIIPGVGAYFGNGSDDGGDLASPAKSLSSLAGSDSESEYEDEEREEIGDISFDPPFASTQRKERGRGASGARRLFGSGHGQQRESEFSFSSSNPFLERSLSSERLTRNTSNRVKLVASQMSGSVVQIYGKYNSQFDVKGRVEEVDRLLERDLQVEYSAMPPARGYGIAAAEGDDGDGDGGVGEEDSDLFKRWLKDDEE